MMKYWLTLYAITVTLRRCPVLVRTCASNELILLLSLEFNWLTEAVGHT
jgi:hypothetical protein